MSSAILLVRKIGAAIEEHVAEHSTTHIEILDALERLRHEFTEDLINSQPLVFHIRHQKRK